MTDPDTPPGRWPLAAPPTTSAPEAAPDALATRHVLPQVRRRSGSADALTLLGSVALVALVGGFTFANLADQRHANQRPAPAAAASSDAAAAALAAPETPRVAPVPAAALAPGSSLAAMPQRSRLDGAPLGVGATPPAASYGGQTLVYDAANIDPPLRAPPPPAANSTGPAPTAPATPALGTDDFATRVGATGGNAASATRAFNPATTIAQGTLIPAVMETALDSEVPGYVRAVVSDDVRAFDGSQVLVPRLSRLVGQYRAGLAGGQRRVYVIWTRLIRPDGVAVTLGSPGTSPDGESGLPGKVSTHFFDRFGSALLLTVVSGLGTLGKGNTSVVIGGAGQSAAAAAINQSGQIAPTLRIRAGAPVRVFTARDLDFSAVASDNATPGQ